MVKLGYVVDQVSFKKMFAGLETTGAKVMKVGTLAATAVVAVEAAVAEFAYSMRKMYFQAELSDTTVKNLTAMAYAGKQVGIEGDAMSSAIHGVAQALRLNPGLKGMLEAMGVKVTGRDVSDVMLDLVDATKQMPEYVGAQYASMFGIDADTYHQMRDHLDELTKKKKENLDLYAQAGIDIDKQKETMLAYTAGLDNLEAHLKVLGSAMMIGLAPTFKWLNGQLLEASDWWTKYFLNIEKKGTNPFKGTVDFLLQDRAKLKTDSRLGPDGKLKPEFESKLNDMSHVKDKTSLPGEAENNKAFNDRMVKKLSLKIQGDVNQLPGEQAAKKAFDEKLAKRLSLKEYPTPSITVSPATPDITNQISTPSLPAGVTSGPDILSAPQAKSPVIPKAPSGEIPKQISDAAMMGQTKYNIPAEVTIAQWQLESNSGKRMPEGSNNPFGIKAKKGEDYVEAMTTENINGVDTRMMAKFKKFKSIEEAFEAHSKLLATAPAYVEARKHPDDPKAFANSLTGKYATDPLYGAKLGALIDQTKLGSDTAAPSKSVTFHQNTTINVTGTEAKSIADQVTNSQSRVYGNALRDLSGAIKG